VSEMKHTPGPWHPAHDQVVTDNDSLICSLSGLRGPGYTQANARLIAAAPELLEALRGLLNALPSATTHPAISAARAAIAKATGEKA